MSNVRFDELELMLMAMFEQPTLKDTIQVLTEVQPLVAEDAEMAASTMYRKSPGALAAGGRCLIGCILSRLSGDKKTIRRSRNRKEAEKVKIP